MRHATLPIVCVFLLALGSLAGADALGWLVTTSVWTDPSTALAPVSKTYASLGGAGDLPGHFQPAAGRVDAQRDHRLFGLGPQPRRLTIEVTLGGNGKRRRNRRANHEAEQDFDQAERHERSKRR